MRPTPTYDDRYMQLWTVPVAGGQPDTLIVDPSGAFCPVWLPDGQRIVYLRGRSEGQVQSEFVIVDMTGGEPVVWEVPEVWDDMGFGLTPEGDKLLYTPSWKPPRETWSLDLATGATESYLQDGGGGRVSPDGQWIAFFTDDDILAVRPASGDPVPVRLLELGGMATWTGDSRFIVFSGIGETGQIDLVLVSRDGTYRRQLTDDAAIEWYCNVSPTGDRVAFSRSVNDLAPHDLWILDLETPPTQIDAQDWGQVKAMYRSNEAANKVK